MQKCILETFVDGNFRMSQLMVALEERRKNRSEVLGDKYSPAVKTLTLLLYPPNA